MLFLGSETTSAKLCNDLRLPVPNVPIPIVNVVFGLIVVDAEQGLVRGDLAEPTNVSSPILVLGLLFGRVVPARFAIFAWSRLCIIL